MRTGMLCSHGSRGPLALCGARSSQYITGPKGKGRAPLIGADCQAPLGRSGPMQLGTHLVWVRQIGHMLHLESRGMNGKFSAGSPACRRTYYIAVGGPSKLVYLVSKFNDVSIDMRKLCHDTTLPLRQKAKGCTTHKP